MFSDFRLTLRSLGKSPAFVAVAVFTLTLGIGVNAAMFGIVNAILLRGLPFGEPERLVAIETAKRAEDQLYWPLSPLELADLRGRQKSFEDLCGRGAGTVNISGPGAEPERANGCTLAGAGPALLHVPVALGRWFTPEEDKPGAPPVVVIGDTIWRNRFHADPAIIGQQLKINGEWATIIGVGPRKFRFPEESDLWKPLRYAKADAKRDERGLAVFGRLKPGVTIAQAGAELATIGRQWAADYPDTNKGIELTVRPMHDTFLDDTTRRLVVIMFGAVLLVLLIACANVANLLLARAATRQKEIAVRVALGAGRGQIVRLLLMEALVLSGAGAALGLPIAYGLMALLDRHLQAKPPPYWMTFNIDSTGVAYVLGLAVLTCVMAGLWPAWRASHADLNTVLKDGGRGSTSFRLSRFTRAMVVGEVVLSCILLVLSGLTIRTVIKIQTLPLGYRTAGVFTARIGLPDVAYKEVTKQVAFFHELLLRLAARPEIDQVGVATAQPTWNNRYAVEIEGQPHAPDAPRKFASGMAVSGGYFATLDIRLVQGRTFDERDTATAPKVAVVSTRFAERHWPGQNPLGRRFAYLIGDSVKPGAWITVIGVVTPVLQGRFDNANADVPQTYTPYTQEDGVRFMTLFARTRGAGDPAALANVVRQTVRALDEDLPIYWPQTLDAMVADAKFFKELFAWIFGIFGGVALVLAAVGLYGVMSYSVSQRTQEIGVRMALGAEPGDVLAMILREGGLRLGVGLVLGLTAAFFAGRLLAFVLFGVEAGDPATFAGTLATLGLAGFVACLVPALRAVRVNPVEALRCG